MRAIFLDRDGVICENRADHVKNWSEFRFLPGAKEAVTALSHLGLPIIVVTNQAAIGRGLVSAEVVNEINHRMVAEMAAYGGRIDRVFCCPHRPDEKCSCRKPEPGLLQQAADEMDINLGRSYLIGDSLADLQAGQKVGCRNFLVLTGRGFEQLLPALHTLGGNFFISRNLLKATAEILKTELNIADDLSSQTYTQHYRQMKPAAII